MAKKNEMIPGQLVLDLSTDVTNYVVQGNELVTAKQSLKLNSAKVVRTLIMQIKPDDTDFKTYHITVDKLSKLLGVSKSNLYRDIQPIINDIEHNWVKFEPKDASKKAYIELPWFDVISYDDELGFLVKISPYLKPYLLNLKNRYTQYQLEDILKMKSVYAIRLYELLIEKAQDKINSPGGAKVTFSLEELRRSLNCENKFERFSQFREKVIDKAVMEICKCTFYDVVRQFNSPPGTKTYNAVTFHIQSYLYKPQ